MGAAAFCVDVLLEKLNSWKFGAVVAVIRGRGGFWAPYLAYLAFCLGYCALAGAIPSYLAPLSAGSGIPEIKAYLNGVRIRGAPVAAWLCFSSHSLPLCKLLLRYSQMLLPHVEQGWHAVSRVLCVRAELLSMKTLVCKLLGVSLSMAGGLMAGKQGPFIHMGARQQCLSL
jgi:chloride channel 7